MKYREYIERIENNDEEFDPGLLSELELDLPRELHGSIMRAVKKENSRARYAKYSKFTAAAAAILVFTISITTIMNTIRNEFTAGNKKAKSPQVQTEIAAKIADSSNQANSSQNNAAQIPVEQFTADGKSAVDTKDVSIKSTPTEGAHENKKTTPKVEPRTLTSSNRGMDSERVTLEENNQSKNPQLLTAAIDDDKTDTTITTENIQSQTLIPEISQVPDMGVSKRTMKTASFYATRQVDYEFAISQTQTDVLSFINSEVHAILVDSKDRIYRLQRQDFIILYNLIYKQAVNNAANMAETSNNINQSDIKDYVFVRIIIK